MLIGDTEGERGFLLFTGGQTWGGYSGWHKTVQVKVVITIVPNGHKQWDGQKDWSQVNERVSTRRVQNKREEKWNRDTSNSRIERLKFFLLLLAELVFGGRKWQTGKLK